MMSGTFLRSLVFVVCAISLIASFSGNANAESFLVGISVVGTSTGNATTVSPINAIFGNSSLGNQFINNISATSAGNAGDIRMVGSNLLSTYGFEAGGSVSATYNGNPVVAVYALAGSVN